MPAVSDDVLLLRRRHRRRHPLFRHVPAPDKGLRQGPLPLRPGSGRAPWGVMRLLRRWEAETERMIEAEARRRLR